MASSINITRRAALKALPILATASALPAAILAAPQIEPPTIIGDTSQTACTLADKIKMIRRIENSIPKDCEFTDHPEYATWKEYFYGLSDPAYCVIRSADDAIAALRFVHEEMLGPGEGDYFPVMLSAVMQWIDPTAPAIAIA